MKEPTKLMGRGMSSEARVVSLAARASLFGERGSSLAVLAEEEEEGGEEVVAAALR